MSIVERVFIQVDDDGEFPNMPLYAAWRGFKLRGRDVHTRTVGEIADMVAEPETLVFGGVEMVREYLGRIGMKPSNIDYPEILRSFLGREFEITILSEIRKHYNEPGPPVFIKPVVHKEFTGHVVSQFRDLLKTTGLPADTPIYKVGHMPFLSEWRCYVEKGTVVGVDHYKGNPLLFPDAPTVEEAARDFTDLDAYALDFGRCEDGQTRLVEVNDMIALGTYGLDPVIYAHLIQLRWDQLTQQASDA